MFNKQKNPILFSKNGKFKFVWCVYLFLMALFIKHNRATATTTCNTLSAIPYAIVILGICINGLLNENNKSAIDMMLKIIKPFAVYFSNTKNNNPPIKIGSILEKRIGTIVNGWLG